MRAAIRQFIVERARDHFRTRGYRHTSMEEVARACRISKPTLYKYFPSKRELFRKVVAALHREIDSRILPMVQGETDTISRLRMLIRKTIEFSRKHRDLIRVMVFDAYMLFLNEALEKGPITGDSFIGEGCLIREHRERQIQMVEDLLRQGKKEGVVRSCLDTRIAAHTIVGALREFVLLHILRESPPVEEKLVEKILGIITRGIVKEE